MEEGVDAIPLYEENKSSQSISNGRLDNEIVKIEHELQEINKLCRPNKLPLKSRREGKAPVFHVSLYSSDTKSKDGIICETSPKDYMHQSPLERYKRFERAKRNSLYKSIDQKMNIEHIFERPGGKLRQADPLLFLDIALTHDILVRLPVTKMDTPSFLAEECFALANMNVPKPVIDKLAKRIETSISEEVQALILNVKQKQKQYIKQQLVHEHHMKQLARDKMKEFNLRTDQRSIERESKKIIGKLSVVVGKNRTGEIVIRQGDDPVVLVDNFITAFSLSRTYTQYFLDAIQNLINNSNKGITPKEIELPKMDEVLFRVQFNMEEGRKVYLDIKKNDNLYKIAQQFIIDNDLDMQKVNTVWEYLQSLYRDHVRSNSQN